MPPMVSTRYDIPRLEALSVKELMWCETGAHLALGPDSRDMLQAKMWFWQSCEPAGHSWNSKHVFQKCPFQAVFLESSSKAMGLSQVFKSSSLLLGEVPKLSQFRMVHREIPYFNHFNSHSSGIFRDCARCSATQPSARRLVLLIVLRRFAWSCSREQQRPYWGGAPTTLWQPCIRNISPPKNV